VWTTISGIFTREGQSAVGKWIVEVARVLYKPCKNWEKYSQKYQKRQ
jgi:hypothetical protein